jgi:hypothetical protein
VKLTGWSILLGRIIHKDSNTIWFVFFLRFLLISMNSRSLEKFMKNYLKI